MKYFLYSIILSLTLLVACSNDEEAKMKAYNPEIFVFDIGGEYEVNATVRLMEFTQTKQGEEYYSSVAYELDLVKPNGETEKAFLNKVEDLNFNEEVKDAGIDIQFNLDSTYSAGEYTLVFNLKDVSTGRIASTSAKFKLE